MVLEHMCAYFFVVSLSLACHSACWGSSSAVAAVVEIVVTVAAAVTHLAEFVDPLLVDAEVCRC